MTVRTNSQLLPRNWMTLDYFELKTVLRQLEVDLLQWQEDRQVLKSQGVNEEDKRYKDVSDIIADHNQSMNALKVFMRLKQ